MTRKNGTPDWDGRIEESKNADGNLLLRRKRAVFTNLKKKLLIYFLLIVLSQFP